MLPKPFLPVWSLLQVLHFSAYNSSIFPPSLYGARRLVLKTFNLAKYANNSSCGTPCKLGFAALQSIGVEIASPAGTIYSGDFVSHDSLSQLSRAYVEDTETSVYDMLKSCIKGPVSSVLGNHHSNPEATGGATNSPPVKRH